MSISFRLREPDLCRYQQSNDGLPPAAHTSFIFFREYGVFPEYFVFPLFQREVCVNRLLHGGIGRRFNLCILGGEILVIFVDHAQRKGADVAPVVKIADVVFQR